MLIMSQVTLTTHPMTVVYSGASLITTVVMLALTPVGQMILDQHCVVLLPQLISKDTMRNTAVLTTVLQQ